MKCRKIAPLFFDSARQDLRSIAGYATQAVTMQAQKMTSNIRHFRVDETLDMAHLKKGKYNRRRVQNLNAYKLMKP